LTTPICALIKSRAYTCASTSPLWYSINKLVIAHPTSAMTTLGRLADNTNRTVS
jgi:hypothetical protein